MVLASRRRPDCGSRVDEHVRRLVVGLATASAVLVGAVAGLWFWADSHLRSPHCEVRDSAVLSLDELAALKRRVDGHLADAERLTIGAMELEFLLSSSDLRHPYVEMVDEEVLLRFGIPVDSGCYNVGLRGQIAVDDGALVIVPRWLAVGSWDLSGWVQGRPLRWQPDEVPHPQLASALHGVRGFAVEDGVATCELVPSEWTSW